MSIITLTNAVIACMTSGRGYDLVSDGVVVVEEDRIRWAGTAAACPFDTGDAAAFDCRGRLLTPGLVDCHTHLVYAGNRALEFEQRLEGVSYAEIARRGGGIMSTVGAVRAADEQTLFDASLPRLERLVDEGVTTVEIKSGYGLDLASEMKMLRVARRLGEFLNVRVKTTFLAAHAIAPEFAGRADEYIDEICRHMLPVAHGAGLVDAVDAFCEHIAFSPAQVARVFEAATALGLPVKCHAEQLSDQGGAAVAARHGALSVDHLEYLEAKDVALLAERGTAAVLLPGAFYVLRETRVPPVDALRRSQVPMALATDCNPGSSPITSPLLIMNMACTLFRMTPAEALAGFTRNGARALGEQDRIGSLEAGKIADLVLWDVKHPAELSYQIGLNPCAAVMTAGRWRSVPAPGREG